MLVQQGFAFLQNEFGFEKPYLDSTNRSYFVNYKKEELLVRVLYSITNNYIEVTIYNHISKVPPGKYDWRYSVCLMHLLGKRDPPLDYNKFMSDKIPLEDSINKLARLLKEYAASILEGKEWISWGEITGFNQYVPPDLP